MSPVVVTLLALIAVAAILVAIRSSKAPELEPNPDEAWDFYICKVDEAPASIFLDLSLADRAPIVDLDTLYAVQIAMADPADHGMGAAEEADTLYAIEDKLVTAATGLGLQFVGRLRNNGFWQVTFMGPKAAEEKLESEARRLLESTGHPFEFVARSDSDWDYYRDFLYPDAERMRWIWDRRVVEQLESHGDALTKKRRVDHWIYFDDPAKRATFVGLATEQGFRCEEAEVEAAERPFGVQAHRVDSVELDEIHDVVMLLSTLAEEHGGDYDGWETSLER